ncbi:uncharacterized protein LOC106138812 [Amyelois transitella]|uniref:uncharacterized protein LOC106138812 n=1 Tax=Amyelois transitella TaxID=680683 RepID=UPI00067CDF52|nr:uncharacterized protein LOC106138812 [Amyelois transitella]
METLAIVLVILCGLLQFGFAITCYECNSATNHLCGENILPDSLKRNCSDLDRGVTHTLCRKIIQHVDYGINGQLPTSRVVRACGWDETKYKGSCYHRSGYGGRQEVCSCTKDLCNNAHASSTSITVLLTTFVIFSLKLK